MTTPIPGSGGFVDEGTLGAGTCTMDLSKGSYHRVTLSAATLTIAFISGTKGDPVPLSAASGLDIGAVFKIEVKNSTGGAVTVTWPAIVKGVPGNPATLTRKIVELLWDGANLVLVNAADDVLN